jgi:insulysin
LSYYCHVGDIADEKVRPRLDLLAEMMSEPFFNTLRTKEQLGYNVTSSRWSRTASLGLRLRVQSERHPDFLETRVDAFLEHYKGVLEEMTEDMFVEYRDGVAKKKREKLKNMQEEQDRFWAHIDSGYFDFERGALLMFHREYTLILSSRT